MDYQSGNTLSGNGYSAKSDFKRTIASLDSLMNPPVLNSGDHKTNAMRWYRAVAAEIESARKDLSRKFAEAKGLGKISAFEYFDLSMSVEFALEEKKKRAGEMYRELSRGPQ